MVFSACAGGSEDHAPERALRGAGGVIERIFGYQAVAHVRVRLGATAEKARAVAIGFNQRRALEQWGVGEQGVPLRAEGLVWLKHPPGILPQDFRRAEAAFIGHLGAARNPVA